MELSIIIPSYNTKALLDRCLKSIHFPCEVIVVDNNSTDGSVELIEKEYKKVILIKNKQNTGYGKANNMAIKQAKGEYILLLNSDCIVTGDALEKMVKFIKKNFSQPGIFVGGKLLNEDRSDQPSCGPFYSLFTVFSMLFLKGDQFHITRYSPKKEKEVDWVSGACLLGKRDAFDDIGLFDEAIFMYMEEIDLLYRAKQKGYAVWYYPEAIFIHTGAASSKNKKEPVVNIYRGLDYFYKKHHSSFERGILRVLLRLKAWLVIGFCEIIGRKETKDLYAKAIDVLSP